MPVRPGLRKLTQGLTVAGQPRRRSLNKKKAEGPLARTWGFEPLLRVGNP